jgi:hypothetical protein
MAERTRNGDRTRQATAYRAAFWVQESTYLERYVMNKGARAQQINEPTLAAVATASIRPTLVESFI